jgi:hypothetical protein
LVTKDENKEEKVLGLHKWGFKEELGFKRYTITSAAFKSGRQLRWMGQGD